MRNILLLFFSLLFIKNSKAQSDSLSLNKLVLSGTAIYTSSMYGAYHLWYKNVDKTNFHWHNDNAVWMQMDKVGHSYSTYHISLFLSDNLKYHSKDYALFSSLYALLLMNTIEIYDGHFDGWGASWGDLIANASGASLFYIQERLWNEQRIMFKFNFIPSSIAQYNLSQLGDSFFKQLLKDYNAQTYWLSFNPVSFSELNIPQWLNVAVGYGANGMTGARHNIPTYLPTDFNRDREFYISLDVDMRRINTRSKRFNKILKVLSFIKIPAPTVIYTKTNGLKFIPIYYGQ